MKAGRTRRSTLAACCVLASGAAQAAEHIVVESSSAAYRIGQSLEGSNVITLRERESLVLVSEEGVTLRVTGPFTGPAAAAAERVGPRQSSLRRALAQLLGSEPGEPGGLAGVRGGLDDTDIEDTRPTPWLIHSAIAGEQCVLRGREVRLWRERSHEEARADIAETHGGRSAEVRWAGDQTRAVWPFDSPPIDGGIYLIRPADGVRSVAIRLHALAPALGDGGLASVAWLAARGCTRQARIVLREAGGAQPPGAGDAAAPR
ncbi:MAG: hypothetical protein JXB36_14990 [Gammaproteobacteria bacterium]|nr:hypothetical protein [Gammaproteobacteria bacterium]